MVYEYKEQYIDSIPESDNRRFCCINGILFISIRLKTGNYIYDALYKYTEEYGYQFIRSVPFGNMIEVYQNGKYYLYLSDLRYKLDISDLKSELIDISDIRVKLKEEYNISEDKFLDNMYYWNGYIYIIYDKNLYEININSNSIDKWDTELDIVYDRLSFIDIEYLYIIGINDKVLMINNTNEKSIQDETVLNTIGNNYSKATNYDTIHIIKEDGSVYKTSVSNTSDRTLSKAEVVYKNMKEVFSLNNTPEFVWMGSNSNIYMVSTNGNHYKIIDHIDDGKLICKFPNKIYTPSIKTSNGEIMKNIRISKNTNEDINNVDELITTFDISSLTNGKDFDCYSMCKCIDDRYIFLSLGSKSSEVCTNILYDTFTKKKSEFSTTDVKLKCFDSKLSDIFFIDVDTLCCVGVFDGKFTVSIMAKNILNYELGNDYSINYTISYAYYLALSSSTFIRVLKLNVNYIEKTIVAVISDTIIKFLEVIKDNDDLSLKELNEFDIGITITDVSTNGNYIYTFDQMNGKTSIVFKFIYNNGSIESVGRSEFTAPLTEPMNISPNSRIFLLGGYIYLAINDGFIYTNSYGFSRWKGNNHISDNGIYIPGNNVVYYLSPYNNGKISLYKILKKGYKYYIEEEE